MRAIHSFTEGSTVLPGAAVYPVLGAGNARGGIRVCGGQACGETYQLFDPSGVDGLTERVGGVVSRRIVPLVVAVFPALSVAVAVRLYTPSWKQRRKNRRC